MVDAVHTKGGLPVGWPVFDEAFGKDTAFLARREQAGLRYLAEVTCRTPVWRRRAPIERRGPHRVGWPCKDARVTAGAPCPPQADAVALRLPAWLEYMIKDGANGVIRAVFACLHVFPIRDQMLGSDSWLVLRRTPDGRAELTYYLSNASRRTRPRGPVRVSGMRWRSDVRHHHDVRNPHLSS